MADDESLQLTPEMVAAQFDLLSGSSTQLPQTDEKQLSRYVKPF